MRGPHAEIFECVEEFGKTRPTTGIVFVYDDSITPASEVVASIREATTSILPVVFYAEEVNPELVVEAMRAGALDYLQWPFVGRILDKVFKRLAEDGRKLKRDGLQSQARAKVEELSEREASVLELLVQGQPNKEMARILGISPRTVEVHRANMMSKLGAKSSSDAIRIGLYAELDLDTLNFVMV